VVGSLAEFGNDIATLAELQAKLAVLDFKDSAARGTVPLALIVLGLAILLASLPVLLAGVALLVASALTISLGKAMLLTAIVALVVGAVVVVVAGILFTRSFASFRRTREELTRNLAWIRTILVYSGRALPKRGRS